MTGIGQSHSLLFTSSDQDFFEQSVPLPRTRLGSGERMGWFPAMTAGRLPSVGHTTPQPCCLAAALFTLLNCGSSRWGSSVVTDTGQEISKDLWVLLPSGSPT